MICRIDPSFGRGAFCPRIDAWQSVADSQASGGNVTAYISQVAHADVAGQIASVLDQALFGSLPDSVIGVIARHDAGWAESDLKALESDFEDSAISFLSVSPAIGVSAWRKSIAAAEAVSPLAAALTRKHFWLLAPRDDDPVHQEFLKEQGVHLQHTDGAEYASSDLDRFASALGFCDLLSLHLCSGSPNCVRIPLAHPADPNSSGAEHVTISVTHGEVRMDRRHCWRAESAGVFGWRRSNSNGLSRARFQWKFA